MSKIREFEKRYEVELSEAGGLDILTVAAALEYAYREFGGLLDRDEQLALATSALKLRKYFFS